ncbi:MAG: HAD family hydrolase [Anaerolineaceae bacterium]|nr:HAD family hydrolase [Anaerolineaceae bacterium]
MHIEGIVFDFDGLILDTETPVFQAWQEVFLPYGVELPLAEWSAAIGASLESFDPVTYLKMKTGKIIDEEKIRAFHSRRSLELVSSQDVLPGVIQYLDNALEFGLKIGLASSSDRAWVMDHLTQFDLVHYFDVICTLEDVRQVKPNPELYQKAVASLGLMPGQAVAFEDAPNGILAAKRAGLYCVAVPNATTRPLDFSAADLVLESFCQMPLDKTLASLNHQRNNQEEVHAG